MAFDRPTLQVIIDRVRASLASSLPGSDTRLRYSVEDVFARVFSGAIHGVYGFAQWMSRQIFFDTAEGAYLERIAHNFGIDRVQASASSGNITAVGDDDTVIPEGTEWTRGDGVAYTTLADATISSGTATVQVRALIPSSASNALESSILSLSTPISGVSQNATVASGGLSGGADAETDEALRERLRLRLSTPPRGGGEGDYVAWALEVAGVTRAWQFPNMYGIGTVGIAFVRDNDDDIIPSDGEVDDVQEHIDSVRPVTADARVYKLDAVDVDVTMSITPDTLSVRSAIEAELQNLFFEKSGPGQTVYLSQINEAISIASGEIDHALASPTSNQSATNLQILRLGSVTFT
jgi:uncharacterized phage protein gp47/JayE